MNFDSTLHRIPTTSSYHDYQGTQQKSRTWTSRLFPNDPWCKAAVIWASSQVLAIVMLEAIIAKMHGNYVSELVLAEQANGGLDSLPLTELIANSRAMTVYHVLFIAAQFFQWILAADTIMNSSMIQLVSTTIFNVASFGYSIVQFKQASEIGEKAIALGLQGLPEAHPTKRIELILIVAMAVFALGWLVLAQRLYRVFGWSIFKELGADISVKKRLKVYHVYMMLLKLDVFFFLGFDVQFLFLVIMQNATNDSEKWTHAFIAIPVTTALLVCGYLAIRRENKILMSFTLIGLSGGIGYLIAKLMDVTKAKEDRPPGEENKYLGSQNSLTFFEALALALCIATFIVAILNFLNFGKGLKEQLNKARGHNVELDYFQGPTSMKDNRWALE
ncbi:hypothetical protein BC832DRAFT_104160 [Gaertneriomyces semiglobifer]|nr:hypothetical protein BC832DRAFT_104160 [Gaertneriomyces semiglobifer]